jgi:hypothetical protein
MNMIRKACVFLTLLGLVAALGFAQSDNASLSGIVKDPSGAGCESQK